MNFGEIWENGYAVERGTVIQISAVIRIRVYEIQMQNFNHANGRTTAVAVACSGVII